MPDPHACLPAGGYFIGTIPDAKRVLFHMGERGRMISPMLKLKKDWPVRRSLQSLS